MMQEYGFDMNEFVVDEITNGKGKAAVGATGELKKIKAEHKDKLFSVNRISRAKNVVKKMNSSNN